jgi:hypothetical protein
MGSRVDAANTIFRCVLQYLLPSETFLDLRHSSLGQAHVFSKLVLHERRRAWTQFNYARCSCSILSRESDGDVDWLCEARSPVARVHYQHKQRSYPLEQLSNKCTAFAVTSLSSGTISPSLARYISSSRSKIIKAVAPFRNMRSTLVAHNV